MARSARICAAAAGFGLALSAVASAHHGTLISYDMEHPWTTKAVMTGFVYANPHPTGTFDRTDEKGNVEHWKFEIGTNPSFMIRAGWTKTRSMEAMKPGTVVMLTICTSRGDNRTGLVRKVQNEKGDVILNANEGANPLRQGGVTSTPAGQPNPNR